MLDVEALAKSIAILFIAIDPLGNAPIFHSITQAYSYELRQRIVLRSVKVATLLLVLFAAGGDVILNYFGLTVNDFRIAGGIILFIYGAAGILGFTEAGAIKPGRQDAEAVAIVPLATPLLAGPAAIATVLYIKAVYGVEYVALSIAFNSTVTLLLLYHSGTLLRILGRSGAMALAKIMSLLLAAIAVAMIREGVQTLLGSC
jgi:multiple antibiotic resistance protein